MSNPVTTWNSHYLRFPGFSWTNILHHGVTFGVLFKSNFPQIMLYAYIMGLVIYGHRSLKVMYALSSSLIHKCIGNLPSTILSWAKKLFVRVLIACSAVFHWFVCSGASWKPTFLFSINYRSTFETSFSNLFVCVSDHRLTSIPCGSLYFSFVASFVRFFMARIKIVFDSWS